MDNFKNTLSENMRRYHTKNLNEQLKVEPNNPIDMVMESLSKLVLELNELQSEYTRKYQQNRDAAALPADSQKKRALGMISQINSYKKMFDAMAKEVMQM